MAGRYTQPRHRPAFCHLRWPVVAWRDGGDPVWPLSPAHPATSVVGSCGDSQARADRSAASPAGPPATPRASPAAGRDRRGRRPRPSVARAAFHGAHGVAARLRGNGWRRTARLLRAGPDAPRRRGSDGDPTGLERGHVEARLQELDPPDLWVRARALVVDAHHGRIVGWRDVNDVGEDEERPANLRPLPSSTHYRQVEMATE
jgi:hypothetical protein